MLLVGQEAKAVHLVVLEASHRGYGLAVPYKGVQSLVIMPEER